MRLDLQDTKEFSAIAAKAGDQLLKIIIEAATGMVPENKKDASPEIVKSYKVHDRYWFKSLEGGHELARKAISLGAWKSLQPQLQPFISAVRSYAVLASNKDA